MTVITIEALAEFLGVLLVMVAFIMVDLLEAASVVADLEVCRRICGQWWRIWLVRCDPCKGAGCCGPALSRCGFIRPGGGGSGGGHAPW